MIQGKVDMDTYSLKYSYYCINTIKKRYHMKGYLIILANHKICGLGIIGAQLAIPYKSAFLLI